MKFRGEGKNMKTKSRKNIGSETKSIHILTNKHYDFLPLTSLHIPLDIRTRKENKKGIGSETIHIKLRFHPIRYIIA